MKHEAWLQGRTRWLLTPVVTANAAVGLLAAPWLDVLLDGLMLDVQVARLLSVAWAGFATAALVGLGLRRLATFQGLADGTLAVTRERRLTALSELRRVSAWLSLASFIFWVATSLLLGVSLASFADGDASAIGRLLFLGALFGPLAAVLVALMLSNRCNEASDRLSDGLPPHDVVAAAPGIDWGVRGRMVAFTVLLTAVPVIVAADMSKRAIDSAPARLAQLTPEARIDEAEHIFRDLAVHLGAFGLLAVAFAVLAASAAGRSIAGPLQQLAQQAQRLAAGELGVSRVIAADGEVWRVTGVFAQLHERLAGLVGKLVGAGRDVKGASEALSRTSARSEATATEQAAALNETSATTEELARSARQIAVSAGSVLELARRTLGAAQQGTHDAAAFQAAVDRMKQDNRSIASAVDRLQRRVQQIGRIVELINTVADRSDLLALSAELEGTRAGDVGRGFSLVGAEMRRLAENVLESTAEVEELIAEIRDATVSTAEATERGGVLTERGTALADDVTASLMRVAELAEETSAQVRTITLATQQQQSGTDQLAEAMGDILTGTQQELVVTQRLAEVNQQLLGLASSLQEAVTRFAAEGEG